MDVSTDIANDPKFRKLHRHAPDHSAAAFVGYLSTLAESWKAGRRVSIDDSWPAFLPFDQTAVEALMHVGLLDNRGMPPAKAWSGWFGAARDRRIKSRERWKRYNANRDADTTGVPRGNDADTATSVPTVPSVRSYPSGSVNGGAPPKPSTIDKDPELRAQRDAIRKHYDDEPVPEGWKVRS